MRPPGPGPTSITATPASGPAARAIFRVRLRSKRKFWPERLAGVKPVRRDHVAERRQPVRGEAHRVSRSASLSAAMRLAGLASPFPAMSNAVP